MKTCIGWPLIGMIALIAGPAGALVAGPSGAPFAGSADAATPEPAGKIRADSVLISLIDHAEAPSEEAGLLVEVAVREGQMVAEGDLLARLDDSLAEIAQRRAKIEFDIATKEAANRTKVQHAKHTLEITKGEMQRITASLEKYHRSISGTEVDQLRLAVEKASLENDQAEHDLAVAQLTMQLKQSELDFATRNVQRRRIVSPIRGMVVQVKRRRGEWVQSGETVLRVLRLDRLRAEGFVEARHVDASFLERRVTVRVNLPDKPRAEFSGQLVFISPEVNPVNGQVRVWAELDNREYLLRPGLPAEMIIDSAGGK